jgi:peroxiredoxin
MAVPAVGAMAPEFSLPCCVGEQQRDRFVLASYRGHKNVVLVFYVLDWTPV